jgi:hypothetical protein
MNLRFFCLKECSRKNKILFKIIFYLFSFENRNNVNVYSRLSEKQICEKMIKCFVFLQLHLGGENMNEQYQDALMVKISKIQSDQNTKYVIESSEILQDDDPNNISTSNIYEYYDSDGELGEKTSENRSKSKRKKVRNV